MHIAPTPHPVSIYTDYLGRGCVRKKKLQLSGNWFSRSGHFVEIVRRSLRVVGERKP